MTSNKHSSEWFIMFFEEIQWIIQKFKIENFLHFEKTNAPYSELPSMWMTHTREREIERESHPKPTTKNSKKVSKNNDQPVDNLPLSLTHLEFGYSFNHTVENLPSSLTHLTFGVSFNQSIDNLPSSLTHLKFYGEGRHEKYSEFNQSVDKL